MDDITLKKNKKKNSRQHAVNERILINSEAYIINDLSSV